MVRSYSSACANWPHLVHASLDPPQSTCKTVSRSIQAFFAQLTAEDPYALQWALLPRQNHPFTLGGCRPHTTKASVWFNDFCRLTLVTEWQTDRQSDHATLSVTIGRNYPRSTAMQLNNNHDNVYGVVIIVRVHPVHLMNADRAPDGHQSSDQLSQLGLLVHH